MKDPRRYEPQQYYRWWERDIIRKRLESQATSAAIQFAASLLYLHEQHRGRPVDAKEVAKQSVAMADVVLSELCDYFDAAPQRGPADFEAIQ